MSDETEPEMYVTRTYSDDSGDHEETVESPEHVSWREAKDRIAQEQQAAAEAAKRQAAIDGINNSGLPDAVKAVFLDLIK